MKTSYAQKKKYSPINAVTIFIWRKNEDENSINNGKIYYH